MSMFGDSNWNKNDLLQEIENFFKNGGTWKDLFEILETFCEFGDYEEIKVSD